MIELTPDLLTSIAKLPKAKRSRVMSAIGRQEWERCESDVLYWLDESKHKVLGPYVYTLDQKPLYLCRHCNDTATHFFDKRAEHMRLFHEIDPQNEKELRGYFIELPTTRPFPSELLKVYIEPVIQRWLQDKYLFVEKSRDMFATWLIVTLYTWDTIFHTGRQNIFQSSDANHTWELLQRSMFIWNHQPKFLRRHKALLDRAATKAGHFHINEINSEILGFPQGPDQIRQYHPSGLFLDEAAFQEKAGDAFAAIKPAIQQGGRFTAISSAAPGWFQLACQDRDGETIAQ